MVSKIFHIIGKIVSRGLAKWMILTNFFILAGGLVDPMVLDVKVFSKRRVRICGTICSLVMFRTYRISEKLVFAGEFFHKPTIHRGMSGGTGQGVICGPAI